jgi:uncharacterized protein (TIGR00645 family)
MTERLIERLLYASRWLLAPLYLGLSLALAALCIKFFQEAFHVFEVILELPEDKLVLTVLSLIDLALVSSLIVMVMLSGYENFVSRIEVATEESEKLGWLGKLDAGTLSSRSPHQSSRFLRSIF